LVEVVQVDLDAVRGAFGGAVDGGEHGLGIVEQGDAPRKRGR
jgi:hypothetical protein